MINDETSPQSKGARLRPDLLSWWQKWVLGTALGGLCVGLGIMTASLVQGEQLITPLSLNSTFSFFAQPKLPKSDKVVYGFLPYWNVNKTTIQPELTHLSYFGLTIGPDGKFILREEAGNLEPGYYRLSSDALDELREETVKNGGEFEVTVVQFNSDDIATFLSNPTAHQNLIEGIDALLMAYPISGVNIDIEYAGTVTPQLQANFVSFMTKLNSFLDSKYDHVTLSIDMYASAASKNTIWDVPNIAPQVDYIVVMAYDFHRRTSPQAGPVAPLFGGKELWDSDISQHLADFLKDVPSEKILLGVPFYGYEWQTVSDEPQAATFPKTGSTASFDRIQKLLANKEDLQLQEKWNDRALSPYLTYIEDGEQYIVYFENSRSLSYKLDFVNQLELGGIAIWALGYEADSRELWDVINRKFYPERIE